MLTNQFLFALIALTVAPVLGAPIPSDNSVVRKGEISAEIIHRAVPLSPRANSRVSVSPSKAKKPAKKAKSTKGAKGKGKQTKHAKSNKWLYRRAEAAKPGETITIGGKQLKLEKVRNNDKKPAAVFKVKWGDQDAYAKQNVNVAEVKLERDAAEERFNQEIDLTKAISNSIQEGLYIADGIYGGSHWLITKAMAGTPFGKLKRIGKITDDKTTAVKKAVDAVMGAQDKLFAATNGYVQGDSNPENWLFSDALDHVNIIDMGIPRKYSNWTPYEKSREVRKWKEEFENQYMFPESSGLSPSKSGSDSNNSNNSANSNASKKSKS